MKKRVKLLTTIASLCLAVALMAFGVYAAQTSTLTVSSSVSFTSQVAVTWTLATEGGAGDNTHLTGTTDVNGGLFAVAANATDVEAAHTYDNLDFNFAPNTASLANGQTIKYTITARNDSSTTDMVVSLATDATLFGHENLTVTVANTVETDGGNVDQESTLVTGDVATVKPGKKLTIVITVVLEDTAIAVAADNTLSVALNASSAS